MSDKNMIINEGVLSYVGGMKAITHLEDGAQQTIEFSPHLCNRLFIELNPKKSYYHTSEEQILIDFLGDDVPDEIGEAAMFVFLSIHNATDDYCINEVITEIKSLEIKDYIERVI